jgi:hypothetical protein
MDNASVGNIFFERGDGATPTEGFTRICAVHEMSGPGESVALVEATTFCSGGRNSYVAGLTDGDEISITLNYTSGDADIDTLIADVRAKVARNYRIVAEDELPSTKFTMSLLPLTWNLSPSVADRNTIAFTYKILNEPAIA